MSVEIVQYPNDAWARYELRFRNGDQGLGDEINVKTVWTQDRPVFVIGSKAFWSSGDKVIVISGNAAPAILDAFINAYLAKVSEHARTRLRSSIFTAALRRSTA